MVLGFHRTDNNQDETKQKENHDELIGDGKARKSQLSKKRSGYLEWNEYFMAIAFLSAQRSKDPRTQVGACIVNSEKKIVGIGYNGMPIGCSDDVMPWGRAVGGSKENWLESKSPYVCHAELNAVLNKNLADISGCTIYVALFPCNMCAQIIIQSRISEVIYYSDKYHYRPEFEASRRLFDTAGVKYWQFHPRQKSVSIDFDLIESTPEGVPTVPVNGTATAISHENTTSNCNNCISMKSFKIEDHAEQQQLQDVDNLELHLPTQPIFWSNSSSPWFNNIIELYFAIISTLLVVLIAIFIYYVSNSK